MKKNQIFSGLFMMVAIMLMAFTFEPIAAMLAIAPVAGLISSLKLKEQRSGFETELRTILDKAKSEKREYSAEENTRRSELLSLIENLDTQIELRMREEKIEARVVGGIINAENEKREDAEMKQFSFLRAVNMASNDKLSGFELEMHQEAIKELRACGQDCAGNLAIPSKIIASRQNRAIMAEKRAALLAGSGSGANFVQTDVNDFIGSLQEKNVLASLGATMLSGLTGNLSIPKSGGSTASWEGETTDNDDGTPTVTPVTASPKRLGAFALLGKQLLIQAGNYDIEKFAQNEVIKAINTKLQQAAIEGGGANQPTGILANISIGSLAGGANGAVPTSNHVIDLEKLVAVGNADVESLAYLTNPLVRAKLKKTALDAGSGQMVWDLKSANELMGYRAGVTNAVPSDLEKGNATGLSALIYGNFADLMMLQWGGFDIVVNPYSYAKSMQVELTVNSFWDIIIRNAASFAAIEDLITD